MKPPPSDPDPRQIEDSRRAGQHSAEQGGAGQKGSERGGAETQSQARPGGKSGGEGVEARDTRQSLLDAAELLFSEHGVDGASMRAITSQAGANVASAHYHFGSKEALLRAVLARRLGPINSERLAMLDRAIDQAEDGNPALEPVVRAFVTPVVRFGHDQPGLGRAFARLCGHAFNAPGAPLRAMLAEELRDVVRRFMAAFRHALPHLSQEELFWRLHFVVGSMAHTLAGGTMLQQIAPGVCDTNNLDRTVEALVGFVIPALLAPAALGEDDDSAQGDRPAD